MIFPETLFGHPACMIMDPVHQGIAFYKHERECMDHPLFQRLRWIVQNDITSFVFPGATHTRFQHSIGAMHIAGRLFQSVIQQLFSERANSAPHAGILDFSDHHVDGIRHLNYLFYCLRLAALLHDTGHFPFSHQLENQAEFKRIIENREVQRSLWQGVSRAAHIKADVKTVHHEHYSLRLSLKILEEADQQLIQQGEGGLPVKLKDVLAVMEDSNVKISSSFVEASAFLCRKLLSDPGEAVSDEQIAECVKSFLNSVISGELDVDKMDYLLRDSFFTGCHYGFYNLSRLLSTIRIGYDFKDPENPWIGIALTEKGVRDIEDLSYSRFQLYRQVYSHKTVVGLKWVLQEAISELMQDEADKSTRFMQDKRSKTPIEDKDNMAHMVSDCDAFLHFTDSYLWEKIRQYAQQNPDSACAHLISRKKLNYIKSEENLQDTDIRNIKEELENNRESWEEVIYYESPIKFSNISGDFQAIKVLSKNIRTGKRQLDSLTQHSSFFEKFGQEVRLVHFFEKPRMRSRSKENGELF